jgi:glycosyltransferase involved in cell wall biosynthesis
MVDACRLRGVRGLRLLMTTDTVGGVFTYALTLASELAHYGAEVHFATMGAPMMPAQRIAADAIDGLVVHESTFALEWMPDPWDDVERAGIWLLELERRIAPDLVHLNGYCHGSAGFRAPVVVVGHSCVLSWWEAVLGEPPPSELARYRAEVSRGIAAARAVIAPTSAMMRCLERHYGPIPDRVVVANGVRAPQTSRSPSPHKELSVLAAGRLWDRAKNVEALARVAPRFPGPVRVAGFDELPDGTRRTLANVETLGWLDAEALGRAMDGAAIFAHPARYEPFGMSPVEAALRGCALVLGDIESLREVWGDAAAFVDPNDDEALSAALEAFARDGDLRRGYAARARARATSFTPARMAEDTAAVYLQLVGIDSASLEGPPTQNGTEAPCV